MCGRNGCLLVLSFHLIVSISTLGQGARERFARESEIPQRPHRASVVRPPIAPPSSIGFSQFVRAAGTIFSGTVTKIERRPAGRGESLETVAVTFHVENAIRGTVRGRNFTITQWMGLWASGQRYRVGERVLLFLYPKSKLGLTSWVGGPVGRFAMDANGRVLLSTQHQAVLGRDPVLGGRSQVRFSDFAGAVRQAGEEE